MNEDGSLESCSNESAANWTPAIHPSVLVAKSMHVAAGKIEAVLVHEGVDVLFFQAEVSIPDLSQLPPGPPPLDRQDGIDTGPEDNMCSRRESFDKGDESPEIGGSDVVQVIEDEPRGARPQSHLVDQRGHDVSDVVSTLGEQVERIGGTSGLDRGKRRRNGRPEPELVMIPPIA